MAGLLSVERRAADRARPGRGSDADRTRTGRVPEAVPAPGRRGPQRRSAAHGNCTWGRRPCVLAGVVRRVADVLLVCGRAPGRALSSGCFGSVSMGAAWVGPLHRTQWAGGHCRLIPRRRRTGPGGERHLPDCASAAPAEILRGCRAVSRGTGGHRRTPGNDRGMKWGERGLLMRRAPHRKVPTRSENGRMSSVLLGWSARFADISPTVGGLSADGPRAARGGSGAA